ncbi:hypothetical protein CTAYLR_003098 [Chrysophaeum taylorii]|uniref:SF4 helicase domain-containing protein n=1 Tax=Chrysophaeum taylorii TaxID=2483200 RepID=A0AAD7XEV3_9STRA|nr:hypothetical protein CTAYLR_003098 [Chrysophaeum taylorii]
MRRRAAFLRRWRTTTGPPELPPGSYLPQHVRSQINRKTVEAYIVQRLGPASAPRPLWRRAGDDLLEVKECPSATFCAIDGKFDRRAAPGNQWKLTIWDSGSFFCHRCRGKGSWLDLKLKWTGVTVAKKTAAREALVEEEGMDQSTATRYVAALMEPEGEGARKMLEERGLRLEVAAEYGVGFARAVFRDDDDVTTYRKHECVTFPWVDPKTNATTRVKLRSLSEKRCMRLEPKGGGWGLFGRHVVPPDATEIVLTEGEFDALAVRQATGRPALSLPNGAASLPPQVLALLEPFSKVYLWMDNDAAGDAGARKFAEKLGLHRCRLVRPPASWGNDPPKDANDALERGLRLDDAIDEAAPPAHEHLARFADLREDVLHELRNPDLYKGVELASLPGLTKLLLGARTGEFTLLSGPTGSGKTTLAAQLAVDLVKQNTPALWGSFEIRNTHLAIKMLKQFARRQDPELTQMRPDHLYRLCDDFERLPLYFMRFHGATLVDDIIDAMTYAKYVYDVEHVILDTLQFMLAHDPSRAAVGSRFDTQDHVVAKFRHFATSQNVHVLLVVHPRKEDPAAPLTIMSIYGGAKAIQEADNVLLLQAPSPKPAADKPATSSSLPTAASANNKPIKALDLVKNRFGGKTGSIKLAFEDKRQRFFELATRPPTSASSS